MKVLRLRELNKEFEGYELCPHCGNETEFRFNPVKETYIVCKGCGEKILPCSLCEMEFGCNYDSCKENILVALNEEVI